MIELEIFTIWPFAEKRPLTLSMGKCIIPVCIPKGTRPRMESMSRRCVRRGSALSDPGRGGGRKWSPQTVTHRQRTEALLVAGTGHLRKNLTSVSVDATCQEPPAVGHP